MLSAKELSSVELKKKLIVAGELVRTSFDLGN